MSIEQKPLWSPTKESVLASNMYKFAEYSKKFGYSGKPDDYLELHRWSVKNKKSFWEAVWNFGEVKFSNPYTSVLQETKDIPWTKWFVGSKLNYAENLLRKSSEHTAIIAWTERSNVSDKKIINEKRISFKELNTLVSKFAGWLKSQGITKGDFVSAYMPNITETIVAFLATNSIGAIWSSCSSEFEPPAVLSRFQQINPKILIACPEVFYNGKIRDLSKKIFEISSSLPSLEKVVLVSYPDLESSYSPIEKQVRFEDIISSQKEEPITFEQVEPDHPIYVLFSSGTTGKPKGITHGTAGVLVKHICEHKLHSNLKESDILFYQTTCGWMMWNWQLSALSQGATIALYDGSPLVENGELLWKLFSSANATIFGTNASYLSEIEKREVIPSKYNLKSLRLILSTGSVLPPGSYDYVYKNISKEVCLSSFSGGTDIVGLFFDTNPMLPVFKDQLQCCSLGMGVEVYNEKGAPVIDQVGSLVCDIPFPSMPIYFWNDKTGERYRSSYFEKFPGKWCHGDWISIHTNGGVTMYGREDATLNKNGVRMGTAEFYNPLQRFPAIQGALAVVKTKELEDKIILYLKLREGFSLTEELEKNIREAILKENSPRHRPDYIVVAPDLPVTRSGKLAELIVRDIINGLPIRSAEGLANEECLEFFRNFHIS